MAVTIQYLGRDGGNTNGATREYAVADSVTVHDGEFVYLVNGRVSSESIAGKQLLGSVVGGDTQDLDRSYSGSATGNSSGTVKVLVNVERDARYLVKADNDTTTLVEAHVDSFFDLIGNAGSQLVDSSTVSITGQLKLIKFNPGIRGTDSSYGIYTIAENEADV